MEGVRDECEPTVLGQDLGAASYANYLLHPITIGQLLQLSPNQPPLTWLYLLIGGRERDPVRGFPPLLEAPLLRWTRGRLRDQPPIEQQVRWTHEKRSTLVDAVKPTGLRPHEQRVFAHPAV